MVSPLCFQKAQSFCNYFLHVCSKELLSFAYFQLLTDNVSYSLGNAGKKKRKKWFMFPYPAHLLTSTPSGIFSPFDCGKFSERKGHFLEVQFFFKMVLRGCTRGDSLPLKNPSSVAKESFLRTATSAAVDSFWIKRISYVRDC